MTVLFYVRVTDTWFEGTYLTEDQHTITFRTNGITKQLAKRWLVRN